MSAVETFLDSLDHPLRAEIDRVRRLVATAEPELAEHIKWNAPSFQADGEDCITLKLNPPKAVQVVFHRGAKAKASHDLSATDPDRLLKWAAPDRGVATFRSMGEIEERAAAFQALVAHWVAAVSRTG